MLSNLLFLTFFFVHICLHNGVSAHGRDKTLEYDEPIASKKGKSDKQTTHQNAERMEASISENTASKPITDVTKQYFPSHVTNSSRAYNLQSNSQQSAGKSRVRRKRLSTFESLTPAFKDATIVWREMKYDYFSEGVEDKTAGIEMERDADVERLSEHCRTYRETAKHTCFSGGINLAKHASEIRKINSEIVNDINKIKRKLYDDYKYIGENVVDKNIEQCSEDYAKTARMYHNILLLARDVRLHYLLEYYTYEQVLNFAEPFLLSMKKYYNDMPGYYADFSKV